MQSPKRTGPQNKRAAPGIKKRQPSLRKTAFNTKADEESAVLNLTLHLPRQKPATRTLRLALTEPHKAGHIPLPLFRDLPQSRVQGINLLQSRAQQQLVRRIARRLRFQLDTKHPPTRGPSCAGHHLTLNIRAIDQRPINRPWRWNSRTTARATAIHRNQNTIAERPTIRSRNGPARLRHSGHARRRANIVNR